MAKLPKVKCLYCGDSIDRNVEKYAAISNRYVHNDCQEEMTKIHEYCKYLFGMKYSKTKIDKNIKEIVENGIKLKYIYPTLVWHYTYNNGDVNKANAGIRIVNYVYPQAMDYFMSKQKNQSLNANLRKDEIVDETPDVVKIKPTPIKKPLHFNLFDLR